MIKGTAIRQMAGITLGCALALPALAAPTDQAVELFRQYCLGSDGDLAAAIQAMDESDTFGNRSGSDGETMRYASFTGPAAINASIKIGFAAIDDHCSIILHDVADPMATSKTIAEALVAPTGAHMVQLEPFDDYGKGGFGMLGGEDQGDVVAAPLTTGISSNIVHINYYP